MKHLIEYFLEELSDDKVKDIKKYVDIKFVKVKGHSGDKYNDLADKLAKEALGI